ncbi:hypothetical protein F4V57_08075 [Acinetobacter qingfengensis]|nr:hypothetical protein [Acinetobacter qingfengensis]KAA8733177.1 hypothetical protein F4V57_08075 [Acinetobacter qingfengensis]
MLCLHAAYFAMIGGSGFFFFYDLGILIFVIAHIQHATSKIPKILALILFIVLLIILILGYGINFWTIAVAGYACLGIVAFRQYSFAFKNMLIIMILIILAYHQHHNLIMLKQHYAQYHTGESWQQFGAL